MDRMDKLRDIPLRYYDLFLGDTTNPEELVRILTGAPCDDETMGQVLELGERIWKAYQVDKFLTSLSPRAGVWFFRMLDIPIHCSNITKHLVQTLSDEDLDLIYETATNLEQMATRK